MSMDVFMHNDRHALQVLTENLAERAIILVRLQVFPFHNLLAAFLKQGFALVGASDNFEAALNLQMVVHISPLNYLPTKVLAGQFGLDTVTSQVFI